MGKAITIWRRVWAAARRRVAGRRQVGLIEHFERYRGVGRETFQALGGGEEYLRGERAAWETRRDD